MVGVGFLLRVTLRRLDLTEAIFYVREPKLIPPVMSPKEIKRLLAMTHGLKAQACAEPGLRLRARHCRHPKCFTQPDSCSAAKPSRLFDHLVGAKQDRLRRRQAERLGGLEVQDHPEICRQLNG
jgi:hypothetical protein